MSAFEREYWDLFDEQRVYVGKTHLRGDRMPEGLYHLVVHAWIMDVEGRFLISQRQKGRTDELKWERTGGSVLAGETSLEGALREVKEELGLDLSKVTPIFLKSVKREQWHDFYDAWLFIVKADELQVKINPVEVKTYRWVCISELKDMEASDMLVKSSTYTEEVYQTYQAAMKTMK